MAAAFATTAAIALTPREALWAFAIHAAVLAVVVRTAGLPIRFVLARLAVILPFVTFALFLPFVAGGEQVDLGGVEVARDGLWAMSNVLTKATLGATVSIVLAGTTEASRILIGLERLRVPVALTTIAAFMLRYLELIADEVSRVRTAMAARGYAPRWLWEARPLGSAAGALFIRSYERGERVHAAMTARGFTGTMPDLGIRRGGPADWFVTATVPAFALAVTLTALLTN